MEYIQYGTLEKGINVVRMSNTIFPLLLVLSVLMGNSLLMLLDMIGQGFAFEVSISYFNSFCFYRVLMSTIHNR